MGRSSFISLNLNQTIDLAGQGSVLHGVILVSGFSNWSHIPSSTRVVSTVSWQTECDILVPPPQPTEHRDSGSSSHLYLIFSHLDPFPPHTPHLSRTSSDLTTRSQPTAWKWKRRMFCLLIQFSWNRQALETLANFCLNNDQTWRVTLDHQHCSLSSIDLTCLLLNCTGTK